MTNRMLKAKQFKTYLQKRKQFHTETKRMENRIRICEHGLFELHLPYESLIEISKIFNIEPLVSKNYSDTHYEYRIYLEDIRVFAIREIHAAERELTNYFSNELYKKYKEYCFDFDNDKQKAFEKLKEKELAKENARYIRENKFYWMKNYSDLERHFNRKRKKATGYNQILNNYLHYKKTWEKRDEDCKYDDYYRPLTFKEWYKLNVS